MKEEKKYLEIVKHYESCLDKYGDSHMGVDWPRKEDMDIRYRVMVDIFKDDNSAQISLSTIGVDKPVQYHLQLGILRLADGGKHKQQEEQDQSGGNGHGSPWFG